MEGNTAGGGGAASPLTARSIRLERVAQALAHSQEELRRRSMMGFSTNQSLTNSMGHMTIPYMNNSSNSNNNNNSGFSPLSSRYGSQESLTRQLNATGSSMSIIQTPTSAVVMGRDVASAVQKKKSIKSSLGRFFSKKDKVVKGGHVKDTIMPDGSTSIISIGNYSINLSETDSSSMVDGGGGSGGGGGITPRAKALFIDYGRQKK